MRMSNVCLYPIRSHDLHTYSITPHLPHLAVTGRMPPASHGPRFSTPAAWARKEMERKARGGRDNACPAYSGCPNARPCEPPKADAVPVPVPVASGTHTGKPHTGSASAQPRTAFEDANSGAPATSTGKVCLCPRAPSREGQSYPFFLAPLHEDQTTSKSAVREGFVRFFPGKKKNREFVS